jgi:hypothetical protein
MNQGTKPPLFWGDVAVWVLVFAWLAWRYVNMIRDAPHIKKIDIVYQEWTASGCSQRNFLTKIGGARNALRLVVTKEILWVTSWFPFSIIASIWDLEHAVPRRSIVRVEPSHFFGRQTFLVTFTDKAGKLRTLRLAPRRPDAFLKSLGVKI